MTNFSWVGFGILVLIGLAVSVAMAGRRHKRDLSQYLGPPLAECGMTFISAVYPGLFKVGPFPMFEMTVGPATTVNGQRGEYSEYRIVNFKDSAGRDYQLWAIV